MRRGCLIVLSLALVGLVAGSALGQATAVQLPTFAFSTASTTVSVPDRGNAYLGGISRASSGRNEFGVPILGKMPYIGPLFKNQSIGQDYGASSFRVTAQIHDFEAMEEAILGAPPSTFAATCQPRPLGESAAMLAGRTLQPRNPAALAGNWAPRAGEQTGPAGLSLADEQARRVAQQQSRVDEAERFFERGRQAEADGKPAVAKIYYQMAVRRASGGLKEQALARLEAVAGAQHSAKIAQNQR